MCGIAGILGGGAGAREQVGVMVNALVHRGPDGEGSFSDPWVALGMRRLAIIDVAGGQQPQSNENGAVWIVFNGEIYNHAELRGELVTHGHVFRTGSDTEVIVHGYEQWGIDGCLERLRGMFALLLWDAPRRELFAARDRLGIKPLYYTQVGRQWFFASEIKALLACAGVPRAVNSNAIAPYLLRQYVPAPETFFEGINKLLPGHYLRLDPSGAPSLRPFWCLSFGGGQDGPAFGAAAAALRQQVIEAVQSHLVSDVPVGCLLSGGLDSAIVTAVMAQLNRQPVRTYTVGFPEVPALDERRYARLVATQYRTKHTELEVSLAAADLLRRVASHLDEPLADAAALPTYAICNAARQHVTVLLTGEGGDELFAGYPRYWLSRIADRLCRLPARPRQAVLGALAALMPDGRARNAWRKLAYAADDPLARNALWTGVFSPAEVAHLRGGQEPAVLADPDSPAWPYCNDTPPRDGLHRLLYWDLRQWLVDDVLMKVDKMSMAASVEARVPFLDHRLVEYAAQLAPEYKLRRGRGKAVLRAAFRDWLPAETAARGKTAFRLPLDEWFRADLGRWLAQVASAGGSFCRSFLDHRAVEGMIADHVMGAAANGQRLWTLLCAELWYAQWFGPQRRADESRAGAQRERGVLVVADLPCERWPSMDRYAQALLGHLDGVGRDYVVSAAPVNGHNGAAPVSAPRRYWNRLVAYPSSLRGYRPDAVHVLDHTYAHILARFPGCPSLLTIHDLWPLRRERQRSARQLVLDELTRRMVEGMRAATLLCADSGFSKREACALAGIPPERVRVIPLGLDGAFLTLIAAARVQEFAQRVFAAAAPRLLHVGSCDARKNIEGLLHIVAELRRISPRTRLLQIGGRFSAAQLLLIAQLQLEGVVQQHPQVSEQDLLLAYRAADALLLPSLYEGFGFPVLEAQAAGLPVLCSNRASLPEVAGDGAVILDPEQPSTWVAAMLDLLESRDRRERLVDCGLGNARQYTWQRTAAAVASLYEELLNH
ncbi:MAG: asparagine synthase (glutamine-hydrolyzing) [Deltaproteobacteria bacterium]|nr:asparagine synthase (glutamine-hydrolyzing) [Deltaproteobacteria bacterium]